MGNPNAYVAMYAGLSRIPLIAGPKTISAWGPATCSTYNNCLVKGSVYLDKETSKTSWNAPCHDLCSQGVDAAPQILFG